MYFSHFQACTSELFKKFNLLKVMDIIKLYTATVMYQFHKGLLLKVLMISSHRYVTVTDIILNLPQNRAIVYLRQEQIMESLTSDFLVRNYGILSKNP